MSRFLAAAVAVVAVVAVAGCSESSSDSCTASGTAGVSVRVSAGQVADGGAGTAACAVRVSLREDPYHEEATCLPTEGDCFCFGAVDRPGKYVVSVWDVNTLLASTSVTVETDGCNVQPMDLGYDAQNPAAGIQLR